MLVHGQGLGDVHGQGLGRDSWLWVHKPEVEARKQAGVCMCTRYFLAFNLRRRDP